MHGSAPSTARRQLAGTLDASASRAPFQVAAVQCIEERAINPLVDGRHRSLRPLVGVRDRSLLPFDLPGDLPAQIATRNLDLSLNDRRNPTEHAQDRRDTACKPY